MVVSQHCSVRIPVISSVSMPRARSHASSVVPSALVANMAECTCLWNTAAAWSLSSGIAST